jgi:hypothetical protein
MISGGTSLLDAGAVVYVNAGSIVVRNGSQTLGTLEAKPFGDAGVGYYPSLAIPMWSVGDVLSVAGSGDTIGPFTGSLAMPGPFINLAPSFEKSSMIVLPTSVPVVISWTPGSSDAYVTFTLKTLTCVARDSVGSITVSPELLQAAESALGGGDSYVFLTREAVVKAPSTNADVWLVAVGGYVQGLAKF